jgi:hypothetical protein
MGPAHGRPHPLASIPRESFEHFISNYYSDPPSFASERLDLDRQMTTEDDVRIARRLMEAFHAACELEREAHGLPRQMEGVWEKIRTDRHPEAYEILDSRDAGRLADYLANGFRQVLSYGFVLGPEIFEPLTKGGTEAWPHLLLIKDRLVRLAIAIGILPLENPEQGQYGLNMHLDFKELVSRIEREIGISISRSKAMGNFGIAIGDGIIDSKVSEDVYSAYRLRQLMKPHNWAAEIGAGSGGGAFMNDRMGCRTVIFDLPIINVIQGYFLIKNLGDAAVSLAGEKPDIYKSRVRVLPWPMFFDREVEFGFVFNRDSMAEFQRDVAERYLTEIVARRVDFLSINQEVENLSGDRDVRQLNVGQLARRAGLQRELRFPHWLRQGYVEELFRSPQGEP